MYDCGGGNMDLWKELGISPIRTYIFHPITEEKFFADVLHLLELIIN